MTAASEENYSNMQEKQQQYPEKTTTAKSEKNIPKSLTDSVQKFLSFVQKQFFCTKQDQNSGRKSKRKKNLFLKKQVNL